MSNLRTHPADTTLILALDRELSFARRVALDRHLIACEACRSRFEAFAETGREVVRLSVGMMRGTMPVRRAHSGGVSKNE